MPDIFIAPRQHRCAPSERLGAAFTDPRPPGSIWRCGDCGRHWFRSSATDGGAPPTHLWKPVRWWNFGHRYRIHQLSKLPHVGRFEGP